MKNKILLIAILFSTIFVGCSSVRTNTEFYNPILTDLKNGHYNLAEKKLIDAEITGEYSDKDRVLLYLDKGIVLHYSDKYKESNKYLTLAEDAIDKLYTKSVSRGAASFILNDNVLEYSGEVYEDLYINVFKALNYINMDDFDGAYVETRKVNDKLNELEIYYTEQIDKYNSDEENKVKIDSTGADYFNNALSHYLSYLIFKAEGEDDNARISLTKLKEAWKQYPEVYNYKQPYSVKAPVSPEFPSLSVVAFSGTSPVKESVGARITTFDDFFTVSDPTEFHIQPIFFPGIKYGWNFKFAFPTMVETGTDVYKIEIYSDSSYVGVLELLESMSNVAIKTFETNKTITYFKTASRAVLKGIGASSLGRTVKKESNSEIVGDLATALFNIVSDASENADLRNWRIMPGYCFVGEFQIPQGKHNIEIRFVDSAGNILSQTFYDNFNIGKRLNLLEAFYLD